MRLLRLASVLCLLGCLGGSAWAAGMEVRDSGGPPRSRRITVTGGTLKLEFWQASGGGMNRVYNLAVDPEARHNLTREATGLFEIGWHCAHYDGPDREDCCPAHLLKRSPRFKKNEKTGKEVRTKCSDGCASWPAMMKADIARKKKDPAVMGTLDIIEQSPARVRIRAKAPFTWWAIWVHDTTAEVTTTVYPSGTIVEQVHIHNPGPRSLHFSGEYGPHLMLTAEKRDDPAFVWQTPKLGQTEQLGAPSEELVLATSDKAKTSFFITIPPEFQKLFNRHMRHNGRGIGWDRAGYGSGGVVMAPGYDNTWTCLIQMSTDAAGNRGTDIPVCHAMTAKDALPLAMQYRQPAKITSAQLVTDDAGDFNTDGYNESEGCHVLKGPGPLSFTYEKGAGAGFCPAFKITGWKGDAPKTVKVDGKDVPCIAAVVDGKLILQIGGTIEPEKAKIEIGG